MDYDFSNQKHAGNWGSIVTLTVFRWLLWLPEGWDRRHCRFAFLKKTQHSTRDTNYISNNIFQFGRATQSQIGLSLWTWPSSKVRHNMKNWKWCETKQTFALGEGTSKRILKLCGYFCKIKKNKKCFIMKHVAPHPEVVKCKRSGTWCGHILKCVPHHEMKSRHFKQKVTIGRPGDLTWLLLRCHKDDYDQRNSLWSEQVSCFRKASTFFSVSCCFSVAMQGACTKLTWLPDVLHTGYNTSCLS